MLDKGHILAEIKRTAKENYGRPLGARRFSNETGIRERDWLGKHWARWGDALREAGFEGNTLQGRLAETVLMEKLTGLIRELGHFPVKAELQLKRAQDSTFPNYKTFGRYTSKPAAAAAVIAWCETQDGYQDVINICSQLQLEKPERVPTRREREEVVFGDVYLLRSGRYYKIGRSNAAGRRERELAIQLPEKATRVHTIKTDDPEGIERYWHARFADRRKHGEWFELKAEDVATFTRRKFM